MVARIRLDVTLYVHCLYCLILNMVVHKATTRLLKCLKSTTNTDIKIAEHAFEKLCGKLEFLSFSTLIIPYISLSLIPSRVSFPLNISFSLHLSLFLKHT